MPRRPSPSSAYCCVTAGKAIEPEDRLRLQHRADVASAAPRRGLAIADILTGGWVIFGVGRGYHIREVETFGAPLVDQNANRELFEDGVEVLFKAFEGKPFSHPGEYERS